MDDPNSVGLRPWYLYGVSLSLQVLLRQTDDYMFITTSLSQARGFLSMMNKGMCSVTPGKPVQTDLGHDEYGCFISTDKTVTNFDFDEQLNSIPHERGKLHLLSLSNCPTNIFDQVSRGVDM